MTTSTLKRFSPILMASVLFIALGCEKQEYQTIEQLDDENIQAYIRQNNLTVERYKQTDLYYQVLEPGTGRDIDFRERYPIVYTIRSLDGNYVSEDTLTYANRYADYLGYYPFGSDAASDPVVERTEDLKEVIKEVLLKTNGKIRIIVPSRLLNYGGRNGVPSLGILPNSSMDYVIHVHDNFEDYENDWLIPAMVKRQGLSIDDFIENEEGILYNILTQGNGDVITADSTVKANYTLKLPDGTILETRDGASMDLPSMIQGWQKVIPLINKGGKVRFFLPSSQAYGATGGSSIPAYTPLDFEVEVLKDDE